MLWYIRSFLIKRSHDPERCCVEFWRNGHTGLLFQWRIRRTGVIRPCVSALRQSAPALLWSDQGKTDTFLFLSLFFLLSPDNLSRTLASMQTPFTPQDVTGMFLNLKFQNGNLMLTTGVSYRIFSTDKSLEHEWDRLVEIFLKNHNIVIEKFRVKKISVFFLYFSKLLWYALTSCKYSQ